jgi:tellurite methyltransferase
MLGFHRDAEEQWVVELSCGHQQHMRHAPPFTLRPWVLSDEGRAARLGQLLECPLCDRRELPRGYAAYKRTPVFTQANIPEGLRRNHETKRGVWGLIHVVSGELEYVLEDAVGTRQVVRAGEPAVVLPELAHRVAPLGDVEFFVEFWRSPKPAGVSGLGQPRPAQ